MNTFARGSGVMLPPEACRALQSNIVIDPAPPVSTSRPWRSYISEMCSSDGTPIFGDVETSDSL